MDMGVPIFALVDLNGEVRGVSEMLAGNGVWDGALVPNTQLVYYEAPPGISNAVFFEEYLFKNWGWVHLGPRPSPYHFKDAATTSWVADLSLAKRDRMAETNRWLAREVVAPITYDGMIFDADSLARERISGTLLRLMRGDGLPAGWIGWRDYDNNMHWGDHTPEQVVVALRGLSTAIEDREQALILQAWALKARIADGDEEFLLHADWEELLPGQP